MTDLVKDSEALEVRIDAAFKDGQHPFLHQALVHSAATNMWLKKHVDYLEGEAKRKAALEAAGSE